MRRFLLGLSLVAMVVASGAVPAMAQEAQNAGEEISVTGLVQDFGSAVEGSSQYGLRDEATGLVYYLAGDSDFGSFVGERVTATGTTEEVIRSLVLNVSSIEPASGPPADGPPMDGPPANVPPGQSATFSFELAVECEPPADAAFLGLVPAESLAPTPLTDPDGDGTYTGTTTVPRFAPGGPPEPVSLPVRIVQGPPTGSSGLGPDYRVIKDFGLVEAEDRTFTANVSYCDGDGGSPDGEIGLGERLVGTDGPDQLEGAAGDDAVYGGYGDDLLQGFDGADLLVAEAGADEVYGGPGDDALYAAFVPWEPAPNAPASHDLLYGGEGDDFVDTTDAPGAFDAVYCGAGDDLVVADAEDFVADDCEEVRRF